MRKVEYLGKSEIKIENILWLLSDPQIGLFGQAI
jgi:hypothetical protein